MVNELLSRAFVVKHGNKIYTYNDLEGSKVFVADIIELGKEHYIKEVEIWEMSGSFQTTSDSSSLTPISIIDSELISTITINSIINDVAAHSVASVLNSYKASFDYKEANNDVSLKSAILSTTKEMA